MSNYIKTLNKIPIVITLTYDGINTLKFQVNPEKLAKSIPSGGRSVEVEGLGEINIPTKPSLASINIKSFFWQDKNLLPCSFYVAWLEKWQASKQPAKLVVTRFNYSMYVTCEKFQHEIRACEEEDVYYELELKEYRPFGAKKVGVDVTKGLFETITDFSPTLPILIDVGVGFTRLSSKVMDNPYITKEGDTITSIARKLSGSSNKWKELYDLNEDVLSEYIVDFKEIPVGTELTVPTNWL